MINPLHILERMEKCNTTPQFKEIQSVSAERKAICEECPFHSKIIKQLE
jgi:hypothetical protein